MAALPQCSATLSCPPSLLSEAKHEVGGRSLDAAVITVDGKLLRLHDDLQRLPKARFEWACMAVGSVDSLPRTGGPEPWREP